MARANGNTLSKMAAARARKESARTSQGGRVIFRDHPAQAWADAVIDRQVFGPDVGEKLYQALRFAPVPDREHMAETSIDSGIIESQGMKMGLGGPSSFRHARKKTLHITVKGKLTLCGFPVAVVDEVLTFRQIVIDFRNSALAFTERGCDECRYLLGVALDTAEAIS